MRFENFDGNLLNPAGTLDVGLPIIGNSFVSDNYTQQQNGTLAIEIGGVLPGDSDQLFAGGNAIVDGTLNVEVINDFIPVKGNQFTIVKTGVGNVAGEFDTLHFPIFNGMTFDVVYNPKSVVLEVIDAPATGDFDHDGDVDGHDFLVWQRNPSVGNLIDWQTQYDMGAGSSPTPISSAIPEPAPGILLGFALSLLLSRSASSLGG